MILAKLCNSHNQYVTFNLAIATSIMFVPNLVNAEVFKTVTADGKVVYTDNLNTAYQYNKNTQAISVLDKLSSQNPTTTASSEGQITTTVTPQSTQSDSQVQSQNQPEVQSQAQDIVTTTANTSADNILTTQTIQPSKAGDYTLKVLLPKQEQAVRRGSQTIDVEVGLTPALKPGDRIIYKLNNTTLATTRNLKYSIVTTNLDPQPYTVTVGVENMVGDIIAQESRTIYLLSNNVVYQQKRKAIAAAEKQKANLPWYKKIKLF